MASQRFNWFWSVNSFQTTGAFAQLFKANYQYISIISINNTATDGEFLDLYLTNAQENSVCKEPCVLKDKK